jgi:hypothetical protein
MTDSERYFSSDYETARARFRRLALEAGGRIETLPLDVRLPSGEPLGIDVARFGKEGSRRVLVHSSGLHGVEGFAGSAIQLQLLERGLALPAGIGMILVHILNPYGMVWLRRVNENNVDLNRNCLSSAEFSVPAPDVYRRLDAFLNPKTPPGAELFALRMAWILMRHGMPALKQAVHSGQYEFPQGLFFGGKHVEQGPRQYLEFLTSALAGAERVVNIDVHTGMGRYGEDTLLCPAAETVGLRKEFKGPVAPLDPEQGIGSRISGLLGTAIVRSLPRAKVTAMIQEFGTYSPVKMFRALRKENRWHHHGGGGVNHPAKQELKAAFCPTDERWRLAVLRRGQALLEQAVEVINR